MEGTIGEIRLFAGNFAPRGWQLCNGSLLPIANYEPAYVIITTMYGGDGITTFAVPDLSGRVPVHTGQGQGLPNVGIGQKGGAESHTLITTQIPNHVHGVALNNAASSKKLNVQTALGTVAKPVADSSLATRANTAALNTYNSAAPDVVLNAGALSPVNVPSPVMGGSQPHENMQPFLALNYIICLEGIFPSRP